MAAGGRRKNTRRLLYIAAVADVIGIPGWRHVDPRII